MEDELKQIYTLYRKPFLAFAGSFGLVYEDAVDILQDTVIAFYEQKERGKLSQLNCSDKTYLYSIGKHKITDFLRRNQRKVDQNLGREFIEKVDPQVYQDIELTAQQNLLNEAVKSLGKSCQKIIHLFYYKKYAIESIVDAMNLKSANVAKAHKSRCMKQLKEIFASNFSR